MQRIKDVLRLKLDLIANLKRFDGGADRASGGILRYPGISASSLKLTPTTAWVAGYAPTYGYGGTGPDCPPDTYYLNSAGPSAWLSNQDNYYRVRQGQVRHGAVVSGAVFAARQLVDVITPCSNFDWSEWEAFAVLRGNAEGIVVNNAPVPVPGHDLAVNLIQDDDLPAGALHANRGIGTTDLRGYYYTRTPDGRAPNHPHHVELDTTPGVVAASLVNTAWRSRYRHRLSFLHRVIPPGATSPWVYCRNDGSIFLVFLDGDKAVNLWRARHVPRSDADWEIKVVALAGAVWAAPRITGDPSHRLRIVATRADGSGVYTSTSDDDGATWTGAA